MLNENNVLDYFQMCLNEEDDDEEISDNFMNEKRCLITSDKLIDNYVTLPCGHKFNYKPLYQEIVCQKVNPNHLEITK